MSTYSLTSKGTSININVSAKADTYSSAKSDYFLIKSLKNETWEPPTITMSDGDWINDIKFSIPNLSSFNGLTGLNSDLYRYLSFSYAVNTLTESRSITLTFKLNTDTITCKVTLAAASATPVTPSESTLSNWNGTIYFWLYKDTSNSIDITSQAILYNYTDTNSNTGTGTLRTSSDPDLTETTINGLTVYVGSIGNISITNPIKEGYSITDIFINTTSNYNISWLYNTGTIDLTSTSLTIPTGGSTVPTSTSNRLDVIFTYNLYVNLYIKTSTNFELISGISSFNFDLTFKENMLGNTYSWHDTHDNSYLSIGGSMTKCFSLNITDVLNTIKTNNWVLCHIEYLGSYTVHSPLYSVGYAWYGDTFSSCPTTLKNAENFASDLQDSNNEFRDLQNASTILILIGASEKDLSQLIASFTS